MHTPVLLKYNIVFGNPFIFLFLLLLACAWTQIRSFIEFIVHKLFIYYWISSAWKQGFMQINLGIILAPVLH